MENSSFPAHNVVIPPQNPENELVRLIDGLLDEIQPCVSSDYCIYRVPQKIRKLNEDAYTPRVVSIGPFHHGDERFKSMEAFKKRYFKNLVQRRSSSSSSIGLKKNYILFLREHEARIRQCYSQVIEMGSNEFLTMILVDGCFIIELLLRSHYDAYRDGDHTILSAPWLLNDIYRDLILLENQLPFFVLEGLFDLSVSHFKPLPLSDLTLLFYIDYNVVQNYRPDFKSIKHFTDLILILHRPTSLPVRRMGKEYQFSYSATDLYEAGVKFKTGSSKCLLEIKFKDGVLEIPCFKLYDRTESFALNLMALEVCHYPNESYVVDYFYFMDYLINTPKDVDLLVESGSLENWIGDSRAAATFFNNLCKNVTVKSDNFFFSSLCEELNAYYKVPRHQWKATLKRDYLSTPWRTASTSAAIVLLVFSFIQTVCSILSAATAY